MPSEWPKPIKRIVVERPHTGRTRARARDIVTLAIRAGEVGGIWSYITGVAPEYIEPGKWKGQLKKSLANKITKAKLSQREKKLLGKNVRHDVLDAIGIGLFSLGR